MNEDITFFGITNFRNSDKKFGIKMDDRRRHMYLVGKSGSAKTTIMETMVINDIKAGRGVCFIDPHGDAAEKILQFIPEERVNDVVYFGKDIFFHFQQNVDFSHFVEKELKMKKKSFENLVLKNQQ